MSASYNKLRDLIPKTYITKRPGYTEFELYEPLYVHNGNYTFVRAVLRVDDETKNAAHRISVLTASCGIYAWLEKSAEHIRHMNDSISMYEAYRKSKRQVSGRAVNVENRLFERFKEALKRASSKKPKSTKEDTTMTQHEKATANNAVTTAIQSQMGVKTVSVKFNKLELQMDARYDGIDEPGAKEFVYKTTLDLEKGDKVLVQVYGFAKVATVSKVHTVPQLSDEYKTRWVLGNVSDMMKLSEQLAEFDDTLEENIRNAEALKRAREALNEAGVNVEDLPQVPTIAANKQLEA